MKKYLWIFVALINVSVAFADGWENSPSNKWDAKDTLYVDTHKVTYIDDTAAKDSSPTYNAAMSEAQALKDTFGMSAPPYTNHRLYAEIVAQNWAPGITYEYLFSDFWSVAARFSYSYFTQKNIAKYTDVEGEMKTFSFPLIVRWYWGRRNMGTSQVIDAVGKNHEIGQMSQIECFLQMRMDPVFYSVDLVSPTDKTRLFPHSENGVALGLGFGARSIGTRFFWGSEISFGRFVKKPQFMGNIQVSGTDKYSHARLLDNIYIETALSVGFVF